MTIKELRDIFKNDTKIFLVANVYSDDEELEKTERFEIKNILYGNSSIAEMPLSFSAVRAAGENEIEVHTDLPLEIFRAWKKYSDDFYEKYGN